MLEDKEFIRAALVGYREQRKRIDEKIKALEGKLNLEPEKSHAMSKKKRHNMSPEGRKRISEAMKKRWAKKQR